MEVIQITFENFYKSYFWYLWLGNKCILKSWNIKKDIFRLATFICLEDFFAVSLNIDNLV